MLYSDITNQIIAAAMKVHSGIGPGVLESVYQRCLAFELERSRLNVRREVPVNVTYEGLDLDFGFRVDLLVEDLIIVELKCAESILPIHKAQLLTYLRLANKPLGLLLNFNVVHMRDGIKRIINNRYQAAARAGQS